MGDLGRKNFETVNDRVVPKFLTASATLEPYERYVTVDSDSAVTVTLPSVSRCAGAIFTIYNVGTGATTVLPYDSGAADSVIRVDGGAADSNGIALAVAGWIMLFCNGIEWFEMGQYDGT